jgi:glycine oxidase
MAAAVTWQKGAGLRIERLDTSSVARVEPALAPVVGGYHFPDDARVEPRALLAATRRAAEVRGARFVAATATRVLHDGARATAVRAGDVTFPARLVVVSAGSWSALLDGGGLTEGDVRPARGQMLELRAAPGLFRGAVIGADAYLSPRDDGRVLVGSTVELVGFDAEPTAAAARDLLAGAIRLSPALGDARLVRAWAGLRPHTSDELPLLGRAAYDGLVIATGHFRNGVLLAPITAEIVTALAEGRPPPVDLAPFSPERFSRLS